MLPRPESVFAAVLDEVRRQDGLFTTTVELARRAGCTPEYVRRALHTLHSRKVITLQTRRGRGGWVIAEAVVVGK